MNYFEIVERYNLIQGEIRELEKEYALNIKGEVYNKRKHQLITKLGDMKNKALSMGVNGHGLIVHAKGKYTRPHRKNPKILVEESFELYLVGIREDEASHLVKLRVKNIKQFTITFIRPGQVLTK